MLSAYIVVIWYGFVVVWASILVVVRQLRLRSAILIVAILTALISVTFTIGLPHE